MGYLLYDLSKALGRLELGEGWNGTPIPGVHCLKFTKTKGLQRTNWRANFSILVQGGKEIVLGKERYLLEDLSYIMTPIDLPLLSRIAAASPRKPFLSLWISLDPMLLNELESQLGSDDTQVSVPSRPAVFVGKVSPPMQEAALRLIRAFRTPEDAPIIGRLVVRELMYYVLKEPEGPVMRQYIRSGSTVNKISKAIYSLSSDLASSFDVAALAEEANMSRSAFFKHFKDLTSMSPIQYQKRLRLLEARRLMMEAGETAEGASYKVGYASPSQFSREYSRTFGSSPMRDVGKQRKA